ncbi:MAG: hypothetical protein AAF546_08095 [Verrucomicrobiota bacterium]
MERLLCPYQKRSILLHRLGLVRLLLCCLIAHGLALKDTFGRLTASEVEVHLVLDLAEQNFAVERLRETLEMKGYRPSIESSLGAVETIKVEIVPAAERPEISSGGFQIEKSEDVIEIQAIDERGAMYGLLELEEQLSRRGTLQKIEPTLQNPRFPFRAIKFNLPWSSYRQFPALEANLEACRDLEMWEDFLNMMAENRFNALTLWNIHPWPYLVRPTNFPNATGFSDEELAEWKVFWKALFRMAKDRGIETYLLNWNAFVSEGFNEHYGKGNVDTGKHFIDGIDSPEIRRYNRECITQVINEYPDLTGLGVTLGEGMEGWSSELQVDWVKDVFFEGIEAADRPIKFIYRAALKGDHTLNRQAIDESGLGTPENPIIVELKFNWSHGHSTPTLVKAHGGGTGEEYWTNPAPTNHKMAWMVRNEDFFRLRWGEPGFIRDHIRTNGQDFVGGYFIGSECYIPAEDIFHVPGHEHINWDWAFERQWLYYMQWGRLLYNPELDDATFAHAYDRRFPGEHGEKMVEAFKLATRTTQRIAGFFSWSWDYTFYTEGFLSRRGFLTLRQLMRTETTEPLFVSIKEFGNGKGNFEGRITPDQLADRIEEDTRRALAIVEGIKTEDGPLLCEIADVKAWSYLGLYFAEKLRGAVALNQRNKEAAILRLETAKSHWIDLVRVTEAHIQPSSLGHLDGGDFHWKDFLDDVEKDIRWAKSR